jgi:hypothetical protein
VVGGKASIESKERGAHVQCFGREAVYDVGGSGKGIRPIGWGHGGLEEQALGDIVCGAKHALGFAILW